MELNCNVAIIGGGPAGLAAALSASENGAEVFLFERAESLGGILNQCIHNGFGLHYFGEELTGTEYAARFIEKIKKSSVNVFKNSFVLSVSDSREMLVLSAKHGLINVKAGAIVLAMGCRERTAGAISLAGERPAGIYTAGFAQRMCNIDSRLVGKKILILGSGDIGLIMARRMTLEGATVKAVCELMPYSSGLRRNIAQCLEDFDIPIHYSTTVTRVMGKRRVEGAFIADVDKAYCPVLETERFVDCDTLLLSVGLIPENDLVAKSGIMINQSTGGAVVDNYRQTAVKGIFSCGNVLHVHDLVDNVTYEAENAGRSAALFSRGMLPHDCLFYNVISGAGIRYALPNKIKPEKSGETEILFRVNNKYIEKKIAIKCADKIIYEKNRSIMTPGEMETVKVDCSLITDNIMIEVINSND